MAIKILGIDPSLRNFGMVRMIFDPLGNIFCVESMRIEQTEELDAAAKKLRKSERDYQCARQIALSLKIESDWADVIFCEFPIGSQSARAMASYGICLGILASVPKPIWNVSPAAVKKTTGLGAEATKKEMIDWAMKKYPNAPWRRYCGRIKLDNEHLADAIATIHAGISVHGSPENLAKISAIHTETPTEGS